MVASGVCRVICEQDIFHVGDKPLLNGLFGVSKEDWTKEGVEIFRFIMNLIPLNRLCMPLSGDVHTLPAWRGVSPFFLQPNESLLVSSEDVKCFFYTMKVPECWVRFLAFNKAVPEEALPADLHGQRVFLASQVLPMGFLNSVSLAQNVHRTLALNSGEPLEGTEASNLFEEELRKDKAMPSTLRMWRIYLDNYDLLEKVQSVDAPVMEGQAAPGILALRHQYEVWEVPRNEKKAVQRSMRCEVQGATVDGQAGVAYPRESKISKYFAWALGLLSGSGGVCGGLVYFSMFRRPLLGGLNNVWTHIESYSRERTAWKTTPTDCQLEVLRFLGMLPLAFMNFRLDIHPLVTCSDASSYGGGICVSSGTTSVEGKVAEGSLRTSEATWPSWWLDSLMG